VKRVLLAGLGLLSVLLTAADAPSEWSARLAKIKVERYVRAPAYAEGPTWRDGELFFCSTGLLRVTRERQVRRYLDLSPAGTYLLGNGHILLCDNRLPALLDLAPDGAVHVLVEKYRGEKLNSLNDVTVDRDGNVYWTDPSGSSRENPDDQDANVLATGVSATSRDVSP
jgi:gluconolactonase